jgi:hypothetical protein
MFGLLVGDEDLEVVEVALAVVTPWSLAGCQYGVSRVLRLGVSHLQLLVQVRISLALLRHDCGRLWLGGEEEVVAVDVAFEYVA